MEIQVTQEQVEQIIESVVEKRLDQFEQADEYGYGFDLEGYAKRKVEDAIRKKVEEKLEEKIDGIAAGIVEDFLSRPVEINSGWGNRKEYKTFSDMFAAEVKKRLDDSWDIKRAIEKQVKERVEEEWRASKDRAVKMVLAEMDGKD